VTASDGRVAHNEPDAAEPPRYSPAANSWTIRCASSSWYCTAGDFMK
jgi:hypothetical protein